jgi:tryptophan synthase alpha chain
MTNRVDKKFRQLKKEKKKAFIAYITAGDPDLATTARLIPEMEKAGVDIIELGVPFSDPLADGLTIQRASERALAKDVFLPDILKMVKGARKKTGGIPILLMSYYNPVYRYGLKKFAKDCQRCGIDGVIIPDLPPEEGKTLRSLCLRNDQSLVFLAAPTSTKKRLSIITKNSTSFIYYVSLLGVTGERKALPSDLIKSVKKLKALTKKPICVGFGISKPAHAQMVARVSDGVIVGSAIVRVIERNKGCKDLPKKVSSFLKPFAKAVHEVRP